MSIFSFTSVTFPSATASGTEAHIIGVVADRIRRIIAITIRLVVVS